MCNAKHLLTTALNVLKMIKQEGNFSQQALTDGFSNNELTFGAAWGWERESCTGSGSRFGAENSGRVTFVTAELWPLQGDFLAWGRHACIDHLFGYSHWDLAVGWGGVVVPGHPISEQCLEPLPHPLGPSDPFCEDAEQSRDEEGEKKQYPKGQGGLRLCYNKLALTV